MQMPPFQVRAQFTRPALPPPFTSTDPSSQNPSPTEFQPKTPDSMQYNLTLQHELWSNTVFAISYAGLRGIHLTGIQNFNIARFEILPDGRKFWPGNTQRFNPAFSSYELRTFGATSSYHSLQLRANKRFSKGLQFQGSYTFSKNIDITSETQIAAAGFMDPYDMKRDRGLSDYDVRHNFSFNYTYDLPIGSTLTGPAGTILRGWQINGLLNVQSGVPVNIGESFNRSRNLNLVAFSGNFERPDLKAGAKSNPVLGGPDRYIDPSSFQVQEIGTLGNLGRNTVIGPGLATFDFSLIKNIYITESRYVQFRAEFFNLFNRANFGAPNPSVFTDASGIPSGSFGRITDTTTTSRQIQFALKLIF